MNWNDMNSSQMAAASGQDINAVRHQMYRDNGYYANTGEVIAPKGRPSPYTGKTSDGSGMITGGASPQAPAMAPMGMGGMSTNAWENGSGGANRSLPVVGADPKDRFVTNADPQAAVNPYEKWITNKGGPVTRRQNMFNKQSQQNSVLLGSPNDPPTNSGTFFNQPSPEQMINKDAMRRFGDQSFFSPIARWTL